MQQTKKSVNLNLILGLSSFLILSMLIALIYLLIKIVPVNEKMIRLIGVELSWVSSFALFLSASLRHNAFFYFLGIAVLSGTWLAFVFLYKNKSRLLVFNLILAIILLGTIFAVNLGAHLPFFQMRKILENTGATADTNPK